MFKQYVVVDVFTNKPLEGNPLAVFTDASGMNAGDMQRIAKEMNLSETTFIFPPKTGGDAYVRVFTPVNELPFAGHPILGTAYVLGNMTNTKKLNIETAMGIIPLTLDRLDDGSIVSAQMEQPIPTYQKYDQAELLLKGLSLNTSTLPIEIYYNGPRHVFVGLPSIAALSQLKPDLNILAKLPDVAVNCFAGNNKQWRTRMFSPAYGVAEDAATGSAAGPLALHLIRYGLVDFGQQIEICQGVEMGRRSIMYSKVMGSEAELDSIIVSGSVVTIARGELLHWQYCTE